ncbi:MAG: M1 family metallopeptidase [Clostridia bacterium]|nr:M1 family metallopeptidase [Deltaproteobacteria bacterium]
MKPIAGRSEPTPPVKADVHTHARPGEAIVRHVSLDLTTDFPSRTMNGSVTLTFDRTPEATQIVLDSKSLLIERVTSGGRPLAFTVGPDEGLIGSAVTIELPEKGDELTVVYTTAADAMALQFLATSQTAGKKAPFLFTQGEAILTRTWIPLQDSPGIRITYDAKIRVPVDLRAVMSAGHVGKDEGELLDGYRVFTFDMPERIPPYLIALAVGDLAFRKLGGRTGVYAEPSVADAAAHEFADTEKMVVAGEALYGPYRWGRYDILVLPPSFPFGGMENPRLTFASPTSIVGDRSMVSLIAHELAHSWSGNLVTNATWSDFWLNEGATEYAENRILEAIYGTDVADLNTTLAWQELSATMEDLQKTPERTALSHPLLVTDDPDDSVNAIAYTKGSSFFRMLEHTIGREKFDAFMVRYFDGHAFQSMTSERFVGLVKEQLFGGDTAMADAARIDEWVFGRGIPDNSVEPKSRLLAQVDTQLTELTTGQAPSTLETATWNAAQWIHFLKNMPEPRTPEQLVAMDTQWRLSQSKNRAIRFEWLRIAAKNRYDGAVASLEEHLSTQGRRRYVIPVYKDLVATDWGRAIAERVFAAARPTYHPLTARSIEQVLATKN